MGNINDGLILPFKFYNDLEKQSRFKSCGIWDADQIAHNEFLISYGCRLLPFQIRRDRSANDVTDFTMSVVNVLSDASTNIHGFISGTDWNIYSSGDYDYISYYGNEDILNGGDCVLENCIYYAIFSDGADTWYSEIFQVAGIGEVVPDMELYRRIWSKGKFSIRQSYTDNNRIWRT